MGKDATRGESVSSQRNTKIRKGERDRGGGISNLGDITGPRGVIEAMGPGFAVKGSERNI